MEPEQPSTWTIMGGGPKGRRRAGAPAERDEDADVGLPRVGAQGPESAFALSGKASARGRPGAVNCVTAGEGRGGNGAAM